MKNNQPKKYLIQCKYCGRMLSKSETGVFFNTEVKCPDCKRIINIPEDVVITLDRGLDEKLKLNNN